MDTLLLPVIRSKFRITDYFHYFYRHGHSCKHVCAVLFFWNLFRSDYFCPTSIQNQWKIPRLEITGKKVENILFRKEVAGKSPPSDSYYRQCESYFDPRSADMVPMTDTKASLVNELVSRIRSTLPNSLFMLFHPTEEPESIPKVEDKTPDEDEKLMNLFQLYKRDGQDGVSEDFVDHARGYYSKFNELVDAQTVHQSSSTLWSSLRCGLLTASEAHSIFTRVNSVKKNPTCDVSKRLKSLFHLSSYRSDDMLNGLEMESDIKKF